MGVKLSNHRSGESVWEYAFFCPGCGNCHGFRTAEWPEPVGLDDEGRKMFAHKWSWNGDVEKPTLTPSLNVLQEIGKDADGKPVYETKCHSFVRDGWIQFLGDCKHELAGQTVEIPDF